MSKRNLTFRRNLKQVGLLYQLGVVTLYVPTYKSKYSDYTGFRPKRKVLHNKPPRYGKHN